MKDQRSLIQYTPLKNKALNYIHVAVGCNCLIALFETGILDMLRKNKGISIKEIKKFGDPTCITSALLTLEKTNVLKRKKDHFYLSRFGKTLCEYMGLITIVFDGYGALVASQKKISQNKIKKKSHLIAGDIVSKSSILISEKAIDPIIMEEISRLHLAGTLCDLGCGYGMLLEKACKKTGSAGLGFDSEPNVVAGAKKRLENTNVSIELGDITKLEGVWEDVTTLMQRHVLHDITPEKTCIALLNSYLYTFPNMRLFFYMDTVSPSIAHNDLLPGFDYVHGLLGIPTRTYEETIEMFSKSLYKIAQEIPLELPNTFLWILIPGKKRTSDE